MKWALKNIGLCVLGFCIVAASASLEMRLESIEAKLEKAIPVVNGLDRLAIAIPAKSVRMR